MSSLDDDAANRIVDYIVEILNGDWAMSIEDAAPHEGTPFGDILAGLIHLHEDLQYRKAQWEEATRELEATTAALKKQNETLVETQEQLTELVADLSSVIIRLPNRTLLVPIVGMLDHKRADRMSARLLDYVSQHRSQRVILELSGVSRIDAQSLEVVLRISKSLRVIGADAVLVGVQPSVASAIADLGESTHQLHVARNVSDVLGRR